MVSQSKRVGRSTSDPQEDLARWVGARQKYRSEFIKLISERQNELLAVQLDHGPRSDLFLNARREVERLESQFDRIQAVIRRPINKLEIRPWVFWLFALALALFEAPVNKFLFDFAIQGTNLTSYVISTCFAIMLLLLAHFAGKCLRQSWSEYRSRVVWSNLAVFLVSTVVLAVLVSILTIGRASFSAGATNPDLSDIFSQIGGQVGELGMLRSLKIAFSDVSALVLFTVNLGGIVVAMFLGIFGHDPDKDYDHANLALQKAKKNLHDIQRRYARDRAKLIKRFSPDLAGTSRNYADANNKVVEHKVLFSQPLDDDDRFVVEALDTLAEESIENEDRLAGGNADPEEASTAATSKIRSIPKA